ncbi:GldG family protein, partial [Bacteroidota bacterium]
NMRKKDKMETQQVYLGAIVQYGEESEVIPAIQPGSPMEYSLTFAIRKLSVDEKPNVAIIKGQGEAGLKELTIARESLSALYTLEEVELTDSMTIPERFKTIAIINPVDSFSPLKIQEINSFMGAGGNVLLAYGYVKGDLSQMPPASYVNSTGLETWLRTLGVDLKQNLVVDKQSTQITVQQPRGNSMMYIPLQFPYIPFISNFSDHPITKGMESMLIPFACEIEVKVKDTNIKATALLKTSKQSGTEPAPGTFDISKQWTDNLFNKKNIPIAYAIEGNLAGNIFSRLVVISNGEFALNDAQGRMQGTPDNINFIAGAIDWLSDESGLSELRTKTISARPLDQIKDSKKNFIKYANVIGPILLLVLIGIFRFRLQKLRMKKWMNE